MKCEDVESELEVFFSHCAQTEVQCQQHINLKSCFCTTSVILISVCVRLCELYSVLTVWTSYFCFYVLFYLCHLFTHSTLLICSMNHNKLHHDCMFLDMKAVLNCFGFFFLSLILEFLSVIFCYSFINTSLKVQRSPLILFPNKKKTSLVIWSFSHSYQSLSGEFQFQFSCCCNYWL